MTAALVDSGFSDGSPPKNEVESLVKSSSCRRPFAWSIYVWTNTELDPTVIRFFSVREISTEVVMSITFSKAVRTGMQAAVPER